MDVQGKGGRRVVWCALHKRKHSQVAYGVNLQKVQQKRRVSKER